jgi:hypothetical protein
MLAKRMWAWVFLGAVLFGCRAGAQENRLKYRWVYMSHNLLVDTNVVGVMYTTWQNRYDDLEAFAKAAWGH